MGKFYSKKNCILSLACLLNIATNAYAQDKNFTTSINTSCKVYNQYPVPNETIEYDGECKEGYAEGKGKVRWYKNSVLHQLSEATFEKGKMEGECSMNILNTKISFKGLCKDDLPLTGSYTDKDGKVYTGEFKNGKPLKN